jgi:hypothetical protein
MRELKVIEIQNVSGGHRTLGPGGGSDPGNRLNDYGVDAGGLRYTPNHTRANVLTTVGIAAGGVPGIIGNISRIGAITSVWMRD